MKDWFLGIGLIVSVFLYVYIEDTYKVSFTPAVLALFGLFFLVIGIKIVISKKAYWPGFGYISSSLLRYRWPKSIKKEKFKPVEERYALLLGYTYILIGVLIFFFVYKYLR